MSKKGFGRFGNGSAMLTSALVMGSSLGTGCASATQGSVANDTKVFFNNYIKPFVSQKEIFKDVYQNKDDENLNDSDFSLFSKDNQDIVNNEVVNINRVDEEESLNNDDGFSLFNQNDSNSKFKEHKQDGREILNKNENLDDDDSFSLFNEDSDKNFDNSSQYYNINEI